MRIIRLESDANPFLKMDDILREPVDCSPMRKKLGAGFRPTGKFFDMDYFDKPNGKSGYQYYKGHSGWKKAADKLISLYSPKSVLDFGCAKGFLVRSLLKRGVKSYGVDISNYVLRKAHRDVKKNLILIRPGEKLTFFSDKSIDLCVSRGVIEHIPEDILDKVITEIIRVSRRQYLNITGGNTKKEIKYALNCDASHMTIKSEKWWIKRLSKLGFEGDLVLNVAKVKNIEKEIKQL